MCPETVGLGPLPRNGRNQGRGFFDFGLWLTKVLVYTYMYKRSTIEMIVNVRFVRERAKSKFLSRKENVGKDIEANPLATLMG